MLQDNEFIVQRAIVFIFWKNNKHSSIDAIAFTQAISA
jgi:hypothetical protein